MKTSSNCSEPAESRIRIHRHSAADRYTQIPNDALRDQRLSWGARGLHNFMLSFPPDWEINERSLILASPGGRDLVRSLVRELESFGYLRRTLIRGVDGKVAHSRWDVWALPDAECPSTGKPSTDKSGFAPGELPLTENPSTANRPQTPAPSTAKPSPVKPSNLQRRSLQTRSRNKQGPENSPQPAPTYDRGPDPEPTTAQLAIAPRTAACPTSPDPAMAALVIEAWNRHKPATWPAIQKLGAKRWPVVVEWSQELGGFQEFLDAIPIALAAAARDPWWGQKAMDWANFMGHGPKSTKQHLLRFYERGMDQPAAPSATAGLSQYVHRMFDHFGVDQSATTANPIDITETSRC